MAKVDIDNDWYTAVMVAYEDRLEERRRKEIEREREYSDRLNNLFKAAVGFNPYFDTYPYIIEGGGNKFEFDYISKAQGTWPVTYHLVLVGKCSICGNGYNGNYKREIGSKADLGEAIKEWLPNLVCKACADKREAEKEKY